MNDVTHISTFRPSSPCLALRAKGYVQSSKSPLPFNDVTSFMNVICDFCFNELPGPAVSRTPHGLRGSGFEARSRRSRRGCLNLEPEIENQKNVNFLTNMGTVSTE